MYGLLEYLSTPVGFIVFIAFMVVLFPFISMSLAYLSGWNKLSREYKNDNGPGYSGDTLSYCSGRFKSGLERLFGGMLGNIKYSNVLKIGGDQKGLLIGANFPFNYGHPDLYIPWEKLDATADETIVWEAIRFTEQETGVEFTLRRSHMEHIENYMELNSIEI